MSYAGQCLVKNGKARLTMANILIFPVINIHWSYHFTPLISNAVS